MSSIICSSTSIICLSLLFDCVFPLLLYISVISIFVYLLFFATVPFVLLVDRFFFILLYTLVNGLLDIFFAWRCFLFVTFLVTLVFVGLLEVKCYHIGLLFAVASSFTRFMLWSMTGLHLCNHFFSCWFVSSSFASSVSSNIFSSYSGSTILRIVYSCVTFFVNESYSATIRPPSTGVVLSIHLSVHISYIIGTMFWKNKWNASVLFFFFFLILFLSLFCSSSFFFFLCFLACNAGFFSRCLVMYACCCIFHCFVNFSP